MHLEFQALFLRNLSEDVLTQVGSHLGWGKPGHRREKGNLRVDKKQGSQAPRGAVGIQPAGPGSEGSQGDLLKKMKLTKYPLSLNISKKAW